MEAMEATPAKRTGNRLLTLSQRDIKHPTYTRSQTRLATSFRPQSHASLDEKETQPLHVFLLQVNLYDRLFYQGGNLAEIKLRKPPSPFLF